MDKVFKTFLVLIIILLVIFPSGASLNKEEVLQHNSQDYSTWVIHSSEYMTIKAQNNSLLGFFNRSSSKSNKWYSAYAEKPIKQATGLKINIDFQFNFKRMGNILLSGFDTNINSSSWSIGYIDGWDGPNGVPFTVSYTLEGGYSQQSYISQNWISSYYGKGHISIYYTSANQINASITVPGESITRQLPLATSIDEVRIYMQEYGNYSTSTDVWKTYNYQENTGITNFSYVSYLSTPPNSPMQQTIDMLFFLAIFGSIIVATIIIVIFSYKKNKQNRVINSRNIQETHISTSAYNKSQYQSSYPNDLNRSDDNICHLCGYRALPREKFCKSCGSRLKS